MMSDLAGHCGRPPALPDCSLIWNERRKNGTPVMIMTTVSGIRKKRCPITSMMLRTRFGIMVLKMSIRMCSLSSSVQGEHSRKTTLNRTHCSSSQELDDVSKVLRTIALIAEMMTATRINQARRLPVQRVNASIPPLNLRSAVNDKSSPDCAPAVLSAPTWAHRLVSPRRYEAAAQNQRPCRQSIGSLLIVKGIARGGDGLNASRR